MHAPTLLGLVMRCQKSFGSKAHADVNQKTSLQPDNGKLAIKHEVGDQSVLGNENFHENIAVQEYFRL
ncbi:hypothetical protein L1987_38108 [Smallanthus sonchifolius]|uniref:Uncharacterized protein n=1 Tax=Smallanthus sonchifolius TaxID=185202 RepID=A0ACB9HJF3_9ASTR|nr:hypothetical protein L1987_38108 [Smallanthus sonchifolius]